MAMTTDELNERLWAGMVVFWEEQAKFWEKAEECAKPPQQCLEQY